MANSSKAITVFTVFVFILSLFSLGIFFLSAKTLFYTISGYATSTGQANLTVETVAAINFTTNKINWGSGRVGTGYSVAYLTTMDTNNVTNGNWTLQTPGGLRIVNIGNINVTLNLSGTKTAAQMIGGTGPAYTWRIESQVEPYSCTDLSGTNIEWPVNEFITVNTTTWDVCPRFQYLDDRDTIRIDFNLTVPSDSKTGLLGDVITATAFASS